MKNISLGIKRFIASVISVLLLSSSVFSSYIGASQVYASDIAVQAYGALWEIFLGIGSTVLLSTGVVENVEDITDIDVAQFGADFMENKMGLSADTANAICSFFIPDAPNSISDKYADAFLAYQNGSMTLEDFKSYDPYADDAFHVYISGLWDDLCNGISTFVDDVINGNNELAYSGQVISVNDIYYNGEYEMVGEQYSVNVSIIREGDSGWTTVFVQNAPLLTSQKQFIYWSPDGYVYQRAVTNSAPHYYTDIVDKMGYARYDYNPEGVLTYTHKNQYPFGFDCTSVSANIPIFRTEDAYLKFCKTGDDSGCVNKVVNFFDFNDIWTGVSSNLSSIVSKGAYKARDLYDTLAGTFSNIANGIISDSAGYVENVSSAIGSLTSYDVTDVPVDPVEPTDPVPPIEKPSDDASVVEWLKYIANTLSMSWTAGSDIPDIVTGIGDYAKDIPDILTGLNDGFSDVIEIGGNTWEVVARIPDIIDKQAEATLENVTKGFNDVIEIGGGIAEKVAEMPDIIDFAKDGVLAGLIDLGDTLSLPLSGVLEGVNSHTGILEGIKSGVLSIPDSITSSTDSVLTAVKDLVLSLIDYTGLLQQIIDLLKQILQSIKDFMSWFVIDFSAIKSHTLAAIDSAPVLSGYEPFLAFVTDIQGQITDHYDYPKITIQTPDILLPFLKTPEIVLLDFKDYAEYFIWVRTVMAFAILFGFCIYVIKEIKVEFTLN